MAFAQVGDQGLDVLRHGHVAGDRFRGQAAVGQAFRELGERALGAAEDADMAAGLGQGGRHRRAQVTGAAGDQAHLAVEAEQPLAEAGTLKAGPRSSSSGRHGDSICCP